MASHWQTQGLLNAELRQLRERLASLGPVIEAAEALVRSPQSEPALHSLERRLRACAAQCDTTFAPQQTIAEAAHDSLLSELRKAAGADARIVDKPWGHEVWWAVTELYAGKILHVESGHRLSLQYHEVKDESCCILSGRALLVTGRTAKRLRSREVTAGATWRNRPGEIHTIEALEDTDVLEVSTPHLDDVVRIQDSYGRVDEAPTHGALAVPVHTGTAC